MPGQSSVRSLNLQGLPVEQNQTAHFFHLFQLLRSVAVSFGFPLFLRSAGRLPGARVWNRNGRFVGWRHLFTNSIWPGGSPEAGRGSSPTRAAEMPAAFRRSRSRHNIELRRQLPDLTFRQRNEIRGHGSLRLLISDTVIRTILSVPGMIFDIELSSPRLAPRRLDLEMKFLLTDQDFPARRWTILRIRARL